MQRLGKPYRGRRARLERDERAGRNGGWTDPSKVRARQGASKPDAPVRGQTLTRCEARETLEAGQLGLQRHGAHRRRGTEVEVRCDDDELAHERVSYKSMQFTLDARGDINVVRAYAAGEIRVGERIVRSNCLLAAHTLIEPWGPQSAQELTAEH